MELDPIRYLIEQGGPILRWLTATELARGDACQDCQDMQDDLLACDEVRHWQSLLGKGPVHHSIDLSAENVLAKLGEYGMRRGSPILDRGALPYCQINKGEPYHAMALILVPFLVRLGYSEEPSIAAWIAQRIDLLYELACQGNYDIYMNSTEHHNLPPGQRTMNGSLKLFYKGRFNQHWGWLGLPTCYDLYMLAYLPKLSSTTRQKVEQIISYLLDPGYQNTPGGYIWNKELHRPYSAGRVFLACLPRDDEVEKLVLFMEMMAHFECGRRSAWFQKNMAHLETFKTDHGTYRFPRRYLSEKHSFYLYAGMHMGLGEWPRNQRAIELESTFRMLRLKTWLE